MSLCIIIVFSVMSFGQVVKTNLYTKPTVPLIEPKTVSKQKDVFRHRVPIVGSFGNLPAEYRDIPQGFRSAENSVVVPQSPQKTTFSALPFGEVLDAEILESLIAFPDSKVPVRAVVRVKPNAGAIFLGEASLEKNSKRVSIDFKKFRPIKGDQSFTVVASALDSEGTFGIAGEYHSGEAKYFTAEFLAALASGYADASLERTANAFGQIQESNTVANAGRKATSSALSRTADRFAEKVRGAAEYVTLKGPIKIQVLIQEQPKLIE